MSADILPRTCDEHTVSRSASLLDPLDNLLFVRLMAYSVARCCRTGKSLSWSKIIHFAPLFLAWSSYVHRRKRFTIRRTHLNIVATLKTTIGRLSANIDAERSILGAVLLGNYAFNDAAEHLKPEDSSIDWHRRIYSRMMDLADSSRPITRRLTRFPSLSTSGPTSPHDLHSSVGFSCCETRARWRILQTAPNKFHRVLEDERQ